MEWASAIARRCVGLALFCALAVENPDVFGDLREQMDRTGKIWPAYKEARRRLDLWAIEQVRGGA